MLEIGDLKSNDEGYKLRLKPLIAMMILSCPLCFCVFVPYICGIAKIFLFKYQLYLTGAICFSAEQLLSPRSPHIYNS